jgi:hypothetical protein
MIFKGSRYEECDLLQKDDKLSIIITPRNKTYLTIEYVVTENDRWDLLAYRFLDDPTLFWMILDVNKDLVFCPDPLMTDLVGKIIKIPVGEL